MKEWLDFFYVWWDGLGFFYLWAEFTNKFVKPERSIEEWERWYDRTYDVIDQINPEYSSRRHLAYRVIWKYGKQYRVYEDDSMVLVVDTN